ncbi:lipopolysaccharide biosynthesis protein [Novosphingobium sp. BL-8H]|uniref:lipopolysaccharide biosynthesis protein n=1 Tax=Novosphingobium sp. BL-8H TaxID=3127640 RepID=UPI003756B6F5
MSERRLLGGAAAMSIAGIVRVGLQTLSLPILARILGPHEYGLVALAMPIVILSMILCDGGLPAPLMRRVEDDERVWATAHWTICASGAVLALLVAIAAWPLAWLCDQPDLAPVVMALAFTLVLQGFGAVPAARLQKAQDFRSLSLVEIGATLGGVAATFAFALHGAGAWSLVAQQLAYWLLRIASVTILSRWRPLRQYDFHLIAPDLAFGWSVLKVSLVNFATRSLDVVLLGMVRDSAQVGLYAMALQVARLPANVILGPFQGVFLSHLVRIKDSPEQVAAMLVKVSAVMAALVVPSTACAALIAPDIFAVMLSEKWRAAGIIYAALVPGAAIQAVVFLVMPCLVALGRPDRQLRQTVRLTGLWLAFATLGAMGGAIGIATGIGCAYLIGGPWMILSVRDVVPVPLRAYLGVIAQSLLAATVAMAALAAFRQISGVTGIALVAAGAVCAGTGVVLALALNRSILGVRRSLPIAA